MTQDPLFPFGFGLSYTSFNIGGGKLSKNAISATETTQLTIPVTNSGKRDGTEVVQVYVHKINDTDGPVKTLRAFKRVNIAAGKTEPAVINLTPKSFEFFDSADGVVKTSPGEYEVFYGSSSDNKDLASIKVTIR